MENLEPILVDEFEAAKYLGLSVSYLRSDRQTSRIGIPFVKIAGNVRYQPQKLKEWVNQQAQSSPILQPVKTIQSQKRGRPTKAAQIAAGKI